ncbi:putative squalene monooxygenase [Tolypocladium ophioglossoides CBS 100239]|uniref:Squalene monooxygenase n=1 Tax=Tolypocladium ophioglossoides (strain CBS 100239) TaxID=1163406 RepID=A0A0L0N543_TOLOC|nr:putative squalene monooxygenase [Tolypocladium ophioglossoides CBS 100239]
MHIMQITAPHRMMDSLVDIKQRLLLSQQVASPSYVNTPRPTSNYKYIRKTTFRHVLRPQPQLQQQHAPSRPPTRGIPSCSSMPQPHAPKRPLHLALVAVLALVASPFDLRVPPVAMHDTPPPDLGAGDARARRRVLAGVHAGPSSLSRLSLKRHRRRRGHLRAAIAVTLARQSRSVFLLERSLKEPDRQALEKLGLRHCLDDIDSIPVKGYQVFFNGRPVTVPYPLDGSTAAGKLGRRPEGLSFHHGRFVRKLRAAAAEEANITVVETEVDGLIKLEGENQVLGVKSSTGGKRDYFIAPLTIVADGYRSKFRGETSSRKPVSKSKFWALELRDATLPSPCFGHVLLGSFSPILLYQIGTHETRALINVPEDLTAAKSAKGG